MATRGSGERDPSQGLDESRSTMSQDSLSALSILCIESNKLRQINFDDLLHDFATTKARKKLL